MRAEHCFGNEWGGWLTKTYLKSWEDVSRGKDEGVWQQPRVKTAGKKTAREQSKHLLSRVFNAKDQVMTCSW